MENTDGTFGQCGGMLIAVDTMPGRFNADHFDGLVVINE
jgi:hypothetical protein